MPDKSTIATAGRPPAPMPLGFACNRCLRERTPSVPICPHCRCPEYTLLFRPPVLWERRRDGDKQILLFER